MTNDSTWLLAAGAAFLLLRGGADGALGGGGGGGGADSESGKTDDESGSTPSMSGGAWVTPGTPAAAPSSTTATATDVFGTTRSDSPYATYSLLDAGIAPASSPLSSPQLAQQSAARGQSPALATLDMATRAPQGREMFLSSPTPTPAPAPATAPAPVPVIVAPLKRYGRAGTTYQPPHAPPSIPKTTNAAAAALADCDDRICKLAGTHNMTHKEAA